LPVPGLESITSGIPAAAVTEELEDFRLEFAGDRLVPHPPSTSASSGWRATEPCSPTGTGDEGERSPASRPRPVSGRARREVRSRSRGKGCRSTSRVSRMARQDVPTVSGSSYRERKPRSNSEVLPIIKMFRHTGSTRSRKRRLCSDPLRLLPALAGLRLFWPSGRLSPAVLRNGRYVRNPIRRMSSSVPLTRSTEPKHCTLAVTRGRITSPESGPLDNSPVSERRAVRDLHTTCDKHSCRLPYLTSGQCEMVAQPLGSNCGPFYNHFWKGAERKSIVNLDRPTRPWVRLTMHPGRKRDPRTG
jgi:hypothetical protein